MKAAIALLILCVSALFPSPAAAGPGICVCTVGVKSWPCAVRYERYGVTWKPYRACIPPRPQSRVDGLASMTPQHRAGNKGGCGMQGLDICTVTDAGKGFVALACDYYAVPDRLNTRLKWRIGTSVTLWGCIALDDSGAATELTAPFTIKKR